MFSVNDRLATTDTLSADDEPTRIPTEHVFRMNTNANQSMSMTVLSTESLPGTV